MTFLRKYWQKFIYRYMTIFSISSQKTTYILLARSYSVQDSKKQKYLSEIEKIRRIYFIEIFQTKPDFAPSPDNKRCLNFCILQPKQNTSMTPVPFESESAYWRLNILYCFSAIYIYIFILYIFAVYIFIYFRHFALPMFTVWNHYENFVPKTSYSN